MTKRPRAVLGCMTFGKQVGLEEADRMLGMFLDAGHQELDTAFIYGEGKAEEILGRILSPERRARLVIATKAHPTDQWGGLSPQRLREQLETSLRRMKLDRVDLFYLHAPDLRTPIEETLEACAQLQQEGKFRELGLSNYTAWETARIFYLAPLCGVVRPTVYQGMYNAVTREVERELFPCVRTLGLRFYAYNPLAGGLLTGRYQSFEEVPEKGRFHEFGFYKDRYWTRAYFDALNRVRTACEALATPMVAAALRWLVHHSMMAGHEADAVILGASSAAHLEQNLKAYAGDPLPDGIRQAFDDAWQIARPACPKYFRP